MRTLKFDRYRVKAKLMNADSNYNLSVYVFLAGNKSPEFGQHFKETVTDRELLEWAFLMIDDTYKSKYDWSDKNLL